MKVLHEPSTLQKLYLGRAIKSLKKEPQQSVHVVYTTTIMNPSGQPTTVFTILKNEIPETQ